MSVGADTLSYLLKYDLFTSYNSLSSMLENEKGDYLFSVLMYFSKEIGSYSLFLTVISGLTNLALLYYINLITQKSRLYSSAILCLLIVSMFSFSSMSCNIIRNGLAVSLLFVFSYYLLHNNKQKAILWGILAMLGHHTIIIPIGFMLFISYFKALKIKWYYCVYLTALGLSLFNVGIHQISFLADLGIDKVNNYIFYDDTEYKIGFRPDFALFNSIFAVLFYYLNSKTRQFEFYFRYYLVTSALFFLWFHIPFSDRIGLYSWTVIPIVGLIGVNERFPIERQKYSILYFVFIFSINFILINR